MLQKNRVAISSIINVLEEWIFDCIRSIEVVSVLMPCRDRSRRSMSANKQSCFVVNAQRVFADCREVGVRLVVAQSIH